MHHALRVDLLHRPDVDGVGGAIPVVRRAFFPSIECPLMISKKVLPRKDGMLFDPNNRLREIEFGLLEHRRIVTAVAVAAPDVEPPPGLEDPRNVAKPRPKQP